MSDAVRQIILASGSSARRKMLQSAGVDFRVVASTIDEEQIRSARLARDPSASPSQIAVELAVAKAVQVSRAHPQAVVIGADQTLSLSGRLVSKAPDLAAARALLLQLRGREHLLHAAVAIAEDGKVSFDNCDTARLLVRSFTDQFLDRYIEAAGDSILYSVGAYELEGLGIQLFEAIDGDFFTILGLPLLTLLSELRRRGVLPA